MYCFIGATSFRSWPTVPNTLYLPVPIIYKSSKHVKRMLYDAIIAAAKEE